MATNPLKTTVRRLLRHKTFSLINILGLSTGIASCLLIYLYVRHELSYDAYHPKADRIARVTSVLRSPESDLVMATSPIVLAASLLKDCPELEAAVRFQDGEFAIRQGSEVTAAEHFYYSEPSVFSIFSFSFIEGSARGALKDPRSIVLTRRVAKKYFGSSPALGKTLLCNGQQYQVTAVIADLPPNSDLPIEGLVSKDFSPATKWAEDDFNTYTFVLFRNKPDLRRFNSRLPAVTGRYTGPELEQAGAKGYSFIFEAEPLREVHFSKGKLVDTPKGNRPFNTIFSALAVFILVIALLNYINLSTAKATERAKEVGVRKAIGARPGQLIRQFLLESSFLMGFAWLLAFGLVAAVIPLFNRMLSTHLSFADPKTILLYLLLFPLTTLLAGAYPAFVLTRFQPVKTLKGSSGASERDPRGVSLRKILTVVQFVIALTMLVGTIVLYHQMNYVKHTDTGVDRTQITCMPIPGDSANRSVAPAFAQALRHESGIRGVTVGSGIPAEGVAMASTTAYSGAKKREFMCNYFFIDPDFLPMLHISLVAGRNFSDSFRTDPKEGFLVNEAFVKSMGWTSPIGQPLEGNNVKGKVVGVVRNFFYKSLHNTIEPMAMIYRVDPPLAVLVKTSPAELPRLKQLWKEYFPSQPFNYFFLDENFDAQYKKDRETFLLFQLFTGLAICISCLGLYGLVSLITIQRTKEIGIRKVLGATLSHLLLLLSKDLLYLVAWSALIAIPLGALGAHRWLSSYAYHVRMNAWMFAAPVGVLLLLALAVTGYRILRTARANPVAALRSE